jgi:YbbR domain-containing protein
MTSPTTQSTSSRPDSQRAALFANLAWFAGALLAALFIWMTAIAQSDPVQAWRLAQSVPIRIQTDDGMIIVDGGTLRTTAAVQLRSQQTERALFAPEDVTITADLRGLGPGTHTVPLTAGIAPERRAVITAISPSQITVSLELRETRLVSVEAAVGSPPPLVVSAAPPTFEVRQVTVTGAASLVGQVAAARATLELAERRESFEEDVRLIAVDAAGEAVEGVQIEPATVRASVTIEPNNEVREVRVQPNPVGSLGDGYILSSFDYDPKVIYVSGPVEVLEALPGTLFTTPIRLSGRTASFIEQVTVELPSPELVIVTGNTITVSVGVDAQIVTRQIDQVPVEVVNPTAGVEYRLNPATVSVLVTGPEPVLSDVNNRTLRVTVDVSGLSTAGAGPPTNGTTAVTPQAAIAAVGDDAAAAANTTIAVLPAQIEVQVIVPGETTPTAEAGG